MALYGAAGGIRLAWAWWIVLIGILIAASGAGAQEGGGERSQAALVPDDCRIRSRGNIRDDGSFSFWDHGTLGDWFVRGPDEAVTLSISAWGKTIGGRAPRAAVEIIGVEGQARRTGRGRWMCSSIIPRAFGICRMRASSGSGMSSACSMWTTIKAERQSHRR